MSVRSPQRKPQQDEEILNQLSVGKLPPQPLTMPERMTIAVCYARPTGAITLDSRDLDSKQVSKAFSDLMKRVVDTIRGGRKLPYFAVPACSTGHDGWHIHCLVWDFIPINPLRRHANEVGFGGVRIDPLLQLGDLDYFRKVAYHPRQNEVVFEITHGDRHKELPKGANSFRRSTRETLKRANPKLLSALDMAQDKSISDEELLRACPLFSSQGPIQVDREQSSSSPSNQVSKYITKQRDPRDQHKTKIVLDRLVSRARQELGMIQRKSISLGKRWKRAIQRLGLGRAGPSG